MFKQITKSIFILFAIFSVVFCSACTDSEFIDSPITTIVDTLELYEEEIAANAVSASNINLGVCQGLETIQNSRFYYFNSETHNYLMIDHCNVLGHFANVEPISFAIYKGTCEHLVCVEHHGDLCGINGGEFAINIEQHTDYYIAVYGPAVDYMFDLRLSFFLKNDNCRDAIQVHKGNLYSSTSAHATFDQAFNVCFVPSSNVWYSFTTGEHSTYALISFCRNGASSNYDNFVSLMKGDDCTSTSCIASDDNSCGIAPELYVPVEPNTHYIFEIGTIGAKGEFTFYFDLVSAVNDICDIAEEITPGVVSGSTVGANMDAISGFCGVPISSNAGNIWYRFDSENHRNVTISTCAPEVAGNTDFDVEIFLFSGYNCNELTCIGGANAATLLAEGCGTGSALTASLTPNTQYFVAVSGTNAGYFEFLFSLD